VLLSLLALQHCITSLAERALHHVPFSSSRLTALLASSLKGII
jgi:hypothetical protein